MITDYKNLYKGVLFFFIIIYIAGNVNAVEVTFSAKPSTAEPGEDIDVNVDIVNKPDVTLGGEIADLQNVEINYLESYPFLLKRKSQGISEPFSLCHSCTKKGTFYFSLDSKASTNVYPLFFELKYGTIIIRKEVLIEVKGFPNLVFNTNYPKDDLKPGDAFNVSLRLKNVGSGLAKIIKLSQESSNFIMEGDNLVFLDQLEPKESKSIGLTFLVSEKIKPGVYLLPITVSGEDSRRNKFNFTQTIGLDIRNKAKINIRNLKVSKDKGLYDIRLRVENVGKGEANDITAELATDYNGFRKNYIGKLDTDEDMPIIFTLDIDKGGSQIIPLIVKYNDDFGNYTIKEKIEFESNKSFGLTTFLIIIIPIIMIFLIIMLFQVRRRHQISET